MQASELVNRIKNKTENTNRLDDITKTLISLKKEQAELKELLRRTFETHSRQIKELYSLYHKIDDVYCSGLANCDVENDEYNLNVCSETEPNDIFPIN